MERAVVPAPQRPIPIVVPCLNDFCVGFIFYWTRIGSKYAWNSDVATVRIATYNKPKAWDGFNCSIEMCYCVWCVTVTFE
jgi:hypothetical protein